MQDLSISIVSYNNKQVIRECLDTLFATLSGKMSVQVYIVNNSQTEKCDDLERFYPVKVIQLPKNVGFGKGHNAVLPLIDSKYHAIVNPDIVFTEEVFEKLIADLEKNPEVGCAAPLMYCSNGNLQDVYRRELTVLDFLARYAPRYIRSIPIINHRRKWHVMADVQKDKPFECDFIQGSFLVIPSALLKKINGFDDRYFMYAEDADLCKRIRQTHKVVCFPDCHIIHKWEKASHRSFKLCRIHCTSLVKYFFKWGWKLW